MCGVVAADALLTLVIVASVGDSPPLMWVAGLYTGLVAGSVAYLLVAHRTMVTSLLAWRRALSREHLLSRELALSAAGRFDWALFAWAAVYIDAATATIIRGAGPILFIVFLAAATNRTAEAGRYERLTGESYLYIGVAFAGLAFVVVGQQPADRIVGGSSLWAWGAGLLLAFLCASARGLSAFNLLWGLRTKTVLAPEAAQSEIEAEAGATIWGTTLANLPVVAVLWLLALTVPGASASPASLGAAIVAGALLNAPGLILYRRANLETRDLGINALGYLTPVLALALLAAAGHLGDVRGGHIVVGTSAIVATNLFLSFDPERRRGFNRQIGFKALVLGFWAFGTFVYFRDEWLPQEMFAWSDGEYWGVLAVVTTMFTLLLAFRMARAQSPIESEVRETAVALRQAEMLVKQRHLHPLALRALAQIDATTDPVRLSRSYTRFKRAHSVAWEAADGDSGVQQQLVRLEAGLDVLLQSKQRSREFAEHVSVAMLGLLAIAVALLARPALAPWNALLVDATAVAVSAAIAFLLAWSSDLQRERRQPYVASVDGSHRLIFHTERSPIVEEVVSVLAGLGMATAFVALLCIKWLG